MKYFQNNAFFFKKKNTFSEATDRVMSGDTGEQ